MISLGVTSVFIKFTTENLDEQRNQQQQQQQQCPLRTVYKFNISSPGFLPLAAVLPGASVVVESKQKFFLLPAPFAPFAIVSFRPHSWEWFMISSKLLICLGT